MDMPSQGNKKQLKFKPTQTIVLSFFIIILVGTILLSLPISTKARIGTPVIDALFTATSAVCVTGLVVVNTLEHWSFFGQTVILILIQIGGLGFMTIVTMVMILAGKKITLKERIIIQESLNQHSLSGMVTLVERVIAGTLLFEGIGAVILAVPFIMDYGFKRGVFMGVFHSISAFCNAGFDIIGDASLTGYVDVFSVNLVLMLLIVIGGLGFTVWVDIINVTKEALKKKLSLRSSIRKLSLHSKVVLTITPILIIGGAVFFFISEFHNPETIGNLSVQGKMIGAAMQSVTTRTAGFDSINQGGMNYDSKLLTIVLMFIGGSPSGTAGGIKTVTLGVIIFAVISVIKGSSQTRAFKRNIPFETLQKALAIFFISLSSVIVITMLLTVTEKGMAYPHEFMDFLFETVSALGTTGLSTGITPHLSSAGKALIAFAMFMGRIGPITIAIALAKKQKQFMELYDYPEGKIMVG